MKVFAGIILWLLLIPINLISVLAAYLLGPVVVLFCSKDGWLPSWLWWFQTPDNPMDGDTGWLLEHWQWRFKLPPALATYVGRVGWCWRNPTYGFALSVLAAHSPKEPFKWYGDPLISNTNPVVDGWLFVTSGIHWNLYIISPSIFGKTLRIYLGWKLRNGEGRGPYQYVMFLNPFKGRG